MITGLREFRKTLSKHISLIKHGQVIIVTDREKPIASLVSVDKLRELAKKANDTPTLLQLKDAQIDINKDFIKKKEALGKEIAFYINESLRDKNRVPPPTVRQLIAVKSALRDLVTEDGTLEDQRLLELIRRKSRGPISRILEFDYYYVHKNFVEATKNEAKKILQDSNGKKINRIFPKDMKLLIDMTEKAILRKKEPRDDRVGQFCSILVRITKNGAYYSSRIYTIMPFWYEQSKSSNYFIEPISPLAFRMTGQKIGFKFKYSTFEYEILSIS